MLLHGHGTISITHDVVRNKPRTCDEMRIRHGWLPRLTFCSVCLHVHARCDGPDDGTDLYPELPAQRASRVFQRRVVSLPTVVQMAAPNFFFYLCLFFLWCFPATAIRAVKPLCTKLRGARVNTHAIAKLSQQKSATRWQVCCAVPGHLLPAHHGWGRSQSTGKGTASAQDDAYFKMACIHDVDSKLIGKTCRVETVQTTPVQTMQ